MSEDRAPRPAGAPSRFRLKGANAMAKETKNGKNLHAGHRARMREKVLMYGLDSMNDHEVLEMLLYYAIPRGDTNETAHLLLDRFKSFRFLLEATPEELASVPGVGQNTAVLIKLVLEASKRYHTARLARRLRLTSTQAIGNFLSPIFIGKREENVYLLCLDAKKTPIYGKTIHVGGMTATALEIPQILSIALSVNAKYVVLAHNHPSGFAVPSDTDLTTTLKLYRALKEVDIRLLDHLIISDPTDPAEPAGDYVSLADSNLF